MDLMSIIHSTNSIHSSQPISFTTIGAHSQQSTHHNHHHSNHVLHAIGTSHVGSSFNNLCACFSQHTMQAPPELNMEGRPQYWVEVSKKGETWLFCREGALAASGRLLHKLEKHQLATKAFKDCHVCNGWFLFPFSNG